MDYTVMRKDWGLGLGLGLHLGGYSISHGAYAM